MDLSCLTRNNPDLIHEAASGSPAAVTLADLTGDPTFSFVGSLLVVGAGAFLLTLLVARGAKGLFKGKSRKGAAKDPWDDGGFDLASGGRRAPAPLPDTPVLTLPTSTPLPPNKPQTAPGAGTLAAAGATLMQPPSPAPGATAQPTAIPIPRPAAPPAEPLHDLVKEGNQEEWPTEQEWSRLFRSVMAEDSILRERGRGLTRRRSLQSLLANLRDRDLLYEKGLKMGQGLHSSSYAELAEKLVNQGLCGEAKFERPPGGGLEIVLVGTAMSKGVPKVGTCLCFVEAGLLAGALASLESAALEVRETLCVGKGDPYCSFRAIPQERQAEEDAFPAFSPPTPR